MTSKGQTPTWSAFLRKLLKDKILGEIPWVTEGWPSGQWQQTVNLPTYVYEGSNPSPSTILPKAAFMTEALPDRLSVNPRSPHFNDELLKQGIGVRFNGAEKTNVEEYCVSEGWIRVAAGRTLDRKGNPMTIKLQGTVEPYIKGPDA